LISGHHFSISAGGKTQKSATESLHKLVL